MPTAHGDVIYVDPASGHYAVQHTWDPTKPVSGLNDAAGFLARFGFSLSNAAITPTNPFDVTGLRSIMNSAQFDLVASKQGNYEPTAQDVYDAKFVCTARGTAVGGFYPNAQCLWDYLVAWAALQVYVPNNPPTSMADAIFLSGKVRTYCKAYFLPGVTAFDQVLTGVLKPGPPLNTGWTRAQLSAAMVARYGKGFGLPVTQDLTVLPAISLIPDPQNNNRAWLFEETFQEPNPNVLAILGFAPGYVLSGWDRTDAQAAADFESWVRTQNALHP